jgi:hypothetical protein
VSEKLSALFLSLQDRLCADLRSNAVLDHPGAKGDSTESDWVKMLTAHLPARYSAHKGFVIDSAGEQSDQIDLVIYDHQYCPLLLNRNDQRFIPAESVYAVFEVKQELDRSNVIYAGEKAASVRRLLRTSAAVPYVEGTYKPKEPPRIIAGILTARSTWSPPFGTAFDTALSELKEDQRLDLGCALEHGGFEVAYGSKPEAAVSAPETALMFFFLRLLGRLQELGTAPAIDFGQYGAALKKP